MTAIRFALNLSNGDWVHRSPDGSLAGLAIDAGRMMSDLLGREAVFVEYPSAGKLFEECDNNAWDVAFLAKDAARENMLRYSEPFFTIDGTLLTRVADRDKPLEMFSEKEIGVAKGSAVHNFLSRLRGSGSLAEYITLGAALDALRAASVRAVAAPTKALNRFQAESFGFATHGVPFMRIDQACAIRRSSIELAADIERILPTVLASPSIALAIGKNRI